MSFSSNRPLFSRKQTEIFRTLHDYWSSYFERTTRKLYSIKVVCTLSPYCSCLLFTIYTITCNCVPDFSSIWLASLVNESYSPRCSLIFEYLFCFEFLIFYNFLNSDLQYVFHIIFCFIFYVDSYYRFHGVYSDACTKRYVCFLISLI